jgi:hypothetical protein
MSETKRRRLLIAGLIVIAACVFLPGIRWGLPSRAIDPYLFGHEPPWSGEKILSLAGGWDEANVGADVDRNPIGKPSKPILLNQADPQRAEIIRRYRLFSNQPDEMITFRALSQMQPGALKLDPKLYQYGGLWIYPVGAALKAASLAGLVDLRSDLAFYLDHPEAFGRFYVVARIYTVLWGLVGVWAVFWIVRRMTGGLLFPATGSLCYILMPVVVNMAHEAKPHLPGAVLMLLAVIAATKFVDSGRTRWWVMTGVLCGAALGMVISSLIGFVIIPTMTLLRPDPWRRRAAVTMGAGLVGGAVYVLTNPYVPINLITNYQLIQSNIGNSTAMYGVGSFGQFLFDGVRLMVEGLSPPLMIAGVAGVVMLVRHHRRGIGWLVAAPAAVVTLQFFALAAGKPAEYARFALLPDIALAIAAVAGLSLVPVRPRVQAAMACGLVLLVLPFGARYVASFVRDVGSSTRLQSAEDLRSIPGPVYLIAEPAPYSAPPIDLFDRRLVLVPSVAAAPGGEGILLRAVDDPIDLTAEGDIGSPLRSGKPGFFETTPISWASKTFAMRYLRDVGG